MREQVMNSSREAARTGAINLLGREGSRAAAPAQCPPASHARPLIRLAARQIRACGPDEIPRPRRGLQTSLGPGPEGSPQEEASRAEARPPWTGGMGRGRRAGRGARPRLRQRPDRGPPWAPAPGLGAPGPSGSARGPAQGTLFPATVYMSGSGSQPPPRRVILLSGGVSSQPEREQKAGCRALLLTGPPEGLAWGRGSTQACGRTSA